MTLAAVLVVTPQASASGSPTAAGWLTRQLVGGTHFVFEGTDIPDSGLTADAVFAFNAAGVAQDSAVKATEFLAQPAVLKSYLGYDFDSLFAGAYAKMALLAQVQGQNPKSFGGMDLIADLQALQAPTGRFSDKSSFGDNSNGVTQSFAIIALHRNSADTVKAVEFQVGAQCPDGGFPLNFGAATCASDVDTTGFVVQALLAVGSNAPAGKALAWLETRQQPSGAFKGSGPTDVENSNSTGLAATALRVGGRDAAADKAVAYLTARQVGCAGAEADRGAIAYDATGFSLSTAVRATTQAVPGISGVGLATVSNAGAKPGAPVLDCTAVPTSSVTAPPPVVEAPPSGPELAVTGPDQVVPLTLAGLLAVVAGSALVIVFRRRAGA